MQLIDRLDSRAPPVFPIYVELTGFGFDFIDVTVPATDYYALLLLKRTLNLASVDIHCFQELLLVFHKLENVNVILLVVYKHVLVVIGNTKVLPRIGRTLHGAYLIVPGNFSMIWNVKQ